MFQQALRAVYNAVLSAVNSGEIPAEKLDDAVGRILTTKGI